MKCDELEFFFGGAASWAEVYKKSDVDAAIDELKADLNRFKAREDVLVTDNRCLLEKVKVLENTLRENAEHFKRNEAQILEASDKLKAENERLNRELEHVKNGDCINTCDVVEKHVKEELKAKRALWMARTMRAHDRGMRILRDSGMMFAVGKCHEWDILNSLQKKWQRVADKCRNKAEEYK